MYSLAVRSVVKGLVVTTSCGDQLNAGIRYLPVNEVCAAVHQKQLLDIAGWLLCLDNLLEKKHRDVCILSFHL